MKAGRWAGGAAAAFAAACWGALVFVVVVVVAVLCDGLRAWERPAKRLEAVAGVDGVVLAGALLVFDPGGRSVVAAVSAVAVLFALACPRVLLLGAAEGGRPPEDVGRAAVPDGTLLLTPVEVGACCEGA